MDAVSYAEFNAASQSILEPGARKANGASLAGLQRMAALGEA